MCHQRGTFGRVAIFETLTVSDTMRDLIARRPHDLEALVRREAIAGGLRPLRRSALDLVRVGAVSLHQVADATPYIPDEALPLVWAESRAAWSAEAALRAGEPAGEPMRTHALALSNGDDAGTQASGPAPHDRPESSGRAPRILLGPERETDDESSEFRDTSFDLLRALADRTAADARASLAGGDE